MIGRSQFNVAVMAKRLRTAELGPTKIIRNISTTRILLEKNYTEADISNHSWRQQNHIWTKGEVQERIDNITKHAPQRPSDYLMRSIMQFMYHSFNFITGYKHDDPSPESIEWRLIILESFAGVPGFLAAGFRHFYSLRNLQRDHGMIATLLEEAENERMHLLVCLKMFEASFITRALVIGAQVGMTPLLGCVYAVHPGSMHRFVGYLEETAVETYANVVEHVERPGTKLNKAWAHLDAPPIAVQYWCLEDGRQKWVDALKCMLADESHHRDVNHCLATLPKGADNPFIHEHMADFDKAAVRRAEELLKEAVTKHQHQQNHQ